jgi:hypothetical protein
MFTEPNDEVLNGRAVCMTIAAVIEDSEYESDLLYGDSQYTTNIIVLN